MVQTFVIFLGISISAFLILAAVFFISAVTYDYRDGQRTQQDNEADKDEM